MARDSRPDPTSGDHAASYDPSLDYRTYEVTSADHPLLSTRAAAQLLGYSQTESVSRLVREGRLPARRANAKYNAPIQIPEWALLGRAHYIGKRVAPAVANEVPTVGTGGRDATRAGGSRVLELENALLVLRAAAEHERRARQLLEEALQESGRANDLLSDALGAVVLPSHPPEIE